MWLSKAEIEADARELLTIIEGFPDAERQADRVCSRGE